MNFVIILLDCLFNKHFWQIIIFSAVVTVEPLLSSHPLSGHALLEIILGIILLIKPLSSGHLY